MALLFLASLAGLLPNATLPVGIGWKSLSVFDLFFAAVVLSAARRRAFLPLDGRLLAAAATFCGTGFLALGPHPSPGGVRAVAITTYSIAVFLFAAHLRVEVKEVGRVIQFSLGIGVVLAWGIFMAENGLRIGIGQNQSGALPASVFRLGGLTGASPLALFLSIAAPYARRSWIAQVVVLITGWATMARSMLGIGVATLLSGKTEQAHGAKRMSIAVLAWGSIVVSLVAYAFGVIPANPDERTAFVPGLKPGAYLTLNRVAFRMWRDAPFLGQGPGRFKRDFTMVATPREQELVGGGRYGPNWDPHSALGGLAAEQGLVGVVAFGWLMAEAYRRFKICVDPEHGAIAIAGMTGLLAGGHFLDWVVLKGVWLWVGLLIAAGRHQSNPAEGLASPAAPAATIRS